MMKMPQLWVKGTCFVLTGRMWAERRYIEQDIIALGGSVSPRMRSGCVLVMASSQLQRNADNKWHPIGKATRKCDDAIRLGGMVYHEKMLRDALADPTGVSKATRASRLDPTRTPRQQAKQARTRPPEWSDELQARLNANMRATSELLATLG